MFFAGVIAALFAVVLGILSQLDLRLVASDLTSAPSSSSVVKFYDAVGHLLMNDFYHHSFELAGMKAMIAHCDIHQGQELLEVGPGSGFLAEQILQDHHDVHYTGVDLSATMHATASARLAEHIKADRAELLLTNNSFDFLQEWEGPVDRYIFTYVLDLLPEADIRRFASLLRARLEKNPSSKVCIVNLTYGFDPLSRVVTNAWQLLYRYLGGAAVGGCRPLQIADYFSATAGFRVEHVESVVSTGVPSEVAVLSLL
jgi:cyclopropane fatty-acyl-phospholipid synthase-like methyltransferase